MCSTHYGLLWRCIWFYLILFIVVMPPIRTNKGFPTIYHFCSKKYEKCNTVQNRAIHAFLGVHRFASPFAIQNDTTWIPPIIRRYLEILA